MRRLTYLSAAPLVSTHSKAAMSGPRAHVLGVIDAFQREGWHVSRFIVGDEFKAGLQSKGAERKLHHSLVLRIAADFIRLVLSGINARRAVALYKNSNWVYERHAVLQSLGHAFQKRGIPWILETNGFLSAEASGDRRAISLTTLARFVEKRSYKKCDVLVCVSHNLKLMIVQQFNIDPNKIVVIPNGVDTVRFKPTNNTDGLTPIIGFVGNIVEWQGLSILIESLKRVYSQGAVFKLRVVGDGAARTELELLTERLGLSDVVEFVGRVEWDAIPEEIAKFDICYSGQVPLKTGVMYHSPLKLYEYMAMGKPIIASAFDDAKATVGVSGCGYLFDPGNVDDLTRVLLEAWADRSEWQRKEEAARSHVVLEHSWDARVKLIISSVERILEERRLVV